MLHTTWFRDLFGFDETSPETVSQNLEVMGKAGSVSLHSKVNQRCFLIGEFSTPSLDELRHQVRSLAANLPSASHLRGFRYDHIPIGDVLEMHSRFHLATFQVCSQFNCLDTNPQTDPESGVEVYASRKTQGPACSMACAAGTVYRHYFVPVRDSNGSVQYGQTKQRQINTLCSLEEAVDNSNETFWTIINGYVHTTGAESLRRLNSLLAAKSDAERERLKSLIRVGVHSDVGVTFTSRVGNSSLEMPSNDKVPVNTLVTQVFAAAISCSRSSFENVLWEPLARLVLEATYEATLLAAVINCISHNGEACSRDVFVAFNGSEGFGNDQRWINEAIVKALLSVAAMDVGLHVHICHYRNPKEDVIEDIDWSFRQGRMRRRTG